MTISSANPSVGRPTFLAGMFLAAFSTLSLELLLTRIYSVTMYYHFAFMVVSLALLGLGVAGVTIYLLPWLLNKVPGITAAAFMLVFACSCLLVLYVSLKYPVSLTNMDLNMTHLPKIYLAACVPFLASGFAISVAISSAGDRIGRVYASDLLGAAAGCVFVVVILPWLTAQGAVIFTGALGALSAALFAFSDAPRARIARIAVGATAMVSALVIGFLGITEPTAQRFGLARNPEKPLGASRTIFEKWNAISNITVTPFGERNYLWIFIDGGATSCMWKGEIRASGWEATRISPEIRVASLVYSVNNEGPALIIGPGGGTDVISALYHEVPRVVGVEINPIIATDVMRERFADDNGRLYFDERVEIVVDDGRSFVRRSEESYSSIQATLVDTWAASSAGAFTLTENSLYTVEAFDEFIGHLKPGGILTMTRWYNPGSPWEMLRLIAIGRAALEKRGVRPGDVHRHFVLATSSDRRASMLLSRDPFTPEQIAALGDRAAQDKLRLLYVPYPIESRPVQKPIEGKLVPLTVKGRMAPLIVKGRMVPETKGTNSLGEDTILAAFLRAPSSSEFLAKLDYDATPTTDNRPFFFCTMRSAEMVSLFGKIAALGTVGLGNLGIMILIYVLIISSALTLLFVILPLVLFRRDALREDRWPKVRVLGYFLTLGLGFILVEIGFMQKFVLFLGHPIYALAVVLATILLASSTGAALSGRAADLWGVRGLVWRVIPVLAAVLLIYAVGLGPIFRALMGLHIGLRIAIAAILVAIPGLMMGMLLPSGIRTANSVGSAVVPWAWGLNGAASVVGSVLAVFLSLNFGFTASLAIGVIIYVLGMIALPPTKDSPAATT